MQKPQVVKKINENILHQGMYYIQEVIAEKKAEKQKKNEYYSSVVLMQLEKAISKQLINMDDILHVVAQSWIRKNLKTLIHLRLKHTSNQ